MTKPTYSFPVVSFDFASTPLSITAILGEGIRFAEGFDCSYEYHGSATWGFSGFCLKQAESGGLGVVRV